MREREWESVQASENAGAREKHTLQIDLSKSPIADITAEERFYSRSVKIRLGVLDCLAKLARRRPPIIWESFEDLGGFCANFVFENRWDSKPASIVTCVRWCKQYSLPNGLVAIQSAGSGSFSINFRNLKSALAISQLLRNYRRRRRGRKSPIHS